MITWPNQILTVVLHTSDNIVFILIFEMDVFSAFEYSCYLSPLFVIFVIKRKLYIWFGSMIRESYYIKQYGVYLSWMILWNSIIYRGTVHRSDITMLPIWPFTELREISTEHMGRMWYVDRGTFTPPDTWSRPSWGWHNYALLVISTVSRNFKIFRTLHFETPSVHRLYWRKANLPV